MPSNGSPPGIAANWAGLGAHIGAPDDGWIISIWLWYNNHFSAICAAPHLQEKLFLQDFTACAMSKSRAGNVKIGQKEYMHVDSS
jgi:hypothetical protein